MVSELHRLGYQRLRIMPYSGPNAWRVAIAAVDQFSVRNGAYMPVEPHHDAEIARYSCAAENHYFGWADAEGDDARGLADKFVVRFPRLAGLGAGRDWTYAGWLSELVGHIEAGPMLPEVFHEFSEIEPDALKSLPIRHEDHRWTEFPLPPSGARGAPG
jgi:hypothetical protein